MNLENENPVHKGACLCGAVSFEVKGPLPPPSACHCTQCRKHSGHFEASTDVPRSAVTIHGSDKVTWYRSEKAQRGFCSTCGSSLFWDPYQKDWTAIVSISIPYSLAARLSRFSHSIRSCSCGSALLRYFTDQIR